MTLIIANKLACTLSKLSGVITSKAEKLLIDILDFLVELMQYKSLNLMDAYQLGDALGKVVLGPADCVPIISEKAGHFLTRMIIEHAKITHHRQNKQQAAIIRRIDSGIDYFPSLSCHSFYGEYKPLSKSGGTQARAKFYNRVVSKTRWASFDWIENTVGVQAMLDNDYDVAPDPPENPWISIFTSTDLLARPHKDMNAASILYRILREASKPIPRTSSDPFAASYLFNESKVFWVERRIRKAFTELLPHQLYTNNSPMSHENGDRSNPLKKLSHSLSHLKLNIKKYRSRQDLLDDSLISDDTDATMVEEYRQQSKISDYSVNIGLPPNNNHYTNNTATPTTAIRNMKSVMKRMIKIGH